MLGDFALSLGPLMPLCWRSEIPLAGLLPASPDIPVSSSPLPTRWLYLVSLITKMCMRGWCLRNPASRRFARQAANENEGTSSSIENRQTWGEGH
jgi:hypothetical protein